jgi:hypothetical protein
LDPNLRKKAVKCYFRGLALYGVETWILQRVDLEYLEGLEIWCWIRTEKTFWTDRINNEAFHGQGGK